MVILGPRKVPVFSGFFDSCVQKTFWPPGDMKMCTQNSKNHVLKKAFFGRPKSMRKKVRENMKNRSDQLRPFLAWK